MCKIIVLALFVLSFCSVVHAQDAVKVDSKHYTVEFENDQVRVLRIKYGPHEKSIMHQHPNAVAIFMTDSNAKFSFPTGEPQNMPSKAGEVRWTPAVTHLPENLGDEPFEVILVELKGSPPGKKMAHKSSSGVVPRVR
jgi:quercetin dioxygenase-like cupin family protein